MRTSLLAILFAAQIQPDNLVIPIGGAPQILIPAAGAIQGANGTFFRSDVTPGAGQSVPHNTLSAISARRGTYRGRDFGGIPEMSSCTLR